MKLAARERRRRAVTRWSPLIVFACMAVGGLGVAMAASSKPSNQGGDVKTLVAAESDSLDNALLVLGNAIGDAKVARAEVLSAFRDARSHYKHLEGIVEFYAPALAAAFNSRRQEVDDDDAPPPSTLGPSGFPALEAVLWPTLKDTKRDSARRIVESIRPLVARTRSLGGEISPTNSQLVELTRLELVRVSTLGIAGFDTPKTGEAMRECAAAVDGVRGLFAATARRWPGLARDRSALDSTLSSASSYLRTNTDFDSFDRLTYLVAYDAPAARALDHLRRDGQVVSIQMPRALRADAITAYDTNAFDATAYAPRTTPRSSATIVALGKRLFFEPKLSGSGTRSCASCHRPDHAFADGRVTPASIDAHSSVTRNTPTLINAALQPAQFDDERAVTLEDQVLEVLRSKAEMGSSVERVAEKLTKDSSYRAGFAKAFGDSGAIAPLRVREALATYVRSLTSLDSRFDRAVRGDTSAVTTEERRGFNLFMGKAGCGTCHFAPLFGGSAPPLYTRSDVEVIGISRSAANFILVDSDSGRERIDHRPEHLRAFKVPSLRNAAQTAPYMHNGRFATLDDVMRFYEAGGGEGAGARVSNQTLAADSLSISPSERRAIIAFLGTLSSRP